MQAASKAGAAGFIRSDTRLHPLGRQGDRVLRQNLQRGVAVPASAANCAQDLDRFTASDHAKPQVSRCIIRCLGRAEDVAGLAVFLCSDMASLRTGQTCRLMADIALPAERLQLTNPAEIET